MNPKHLTTVIALILIAFGAIFQVPSSLAGPPTGTTTSGPVYLSYGGTYCNSSYANF